MDVIAAVVALGIGGGLGAWLVVRLVVRHLHRSLDTRLGTTDAELRRLGDASVWRERGTNDLRREIAALHGALDEMRAREGERQAREEQGWATLHRVAAVLSGGHGAGRVGENVLREAFAHLPPSMVETDLRVNGRVVEFGLVLPDGRRLPVDSKWPADRELRALAESNDPVERDRLVRIIERTVAERARDVAGYRDPALTAPVAVAAVPDAAYAVLRRAHADAYRQGVIVIPYSMALPVVLFLHGIVSRFGGTGDIQECLVDLAAVLDGIESVVENKVARASAMLANGADELRAHAGKARTALSRVRGADGRDEAAEEGGEAGGRPRLVGLSP